jgi:spermidine synthase
MQNFKWFLEQTSKDEGAFYSLKEIIFQGKSDYQQIEIIRSGPFGKCFILDGKMQSSEADEFIYHEALVHPAMAAHDLPLKVLIAGGGEGATAREVLRYSSVEEVFIVDLDREAVEVSKKYLPEWHCGAFEDKRVKLFFDDGRRYLEREGKFDVILLDLPEPTDNGPALMLYTKEFYELVFSHLTKDGIAVTQAASSAVHNLHIFTAIANTIAHVFPIVRPYIANIPSFFIPWGFILASKKTDPLKLSSDEIERRLSGIKDKLRFYDSLTHAGIFSLPKYLREAVKQQNMIITDSSPASFY